MKPEAQVLNDDGDSDVDDCQMLETFQAVLGCPPMSVVKHEPEQAPEPVPAPKPAELPPAPSMPEPAFAPDTTSATQLTECVPAPKST